MARIKVKVGSAEAEVEANFEELREAIDLVPALASKLPGFGSEDEPPSETPTSLQQSAAREARSQVPVVSLEKGDSLSDVIGKFFSGPWGTERRKLSDVREALQSYGLNYPKQSVAVALLRLAKTTKLRRFRGEDGEFVYTSPSMVPRAQAPELLQSEEFAASQPN